jgi:hypothetical protein
VRYLAVASLAIVLAGCGSARPHPVAAPFVKEALLESAGEPDIGSSRDGAGELVRFMPHAEFGIGIVLDNRSGEEIVVTQVRAVEPQDSVTRQIGTLLQPWRRPTCPPGAFSCPFAGFELRPFATAAPQPVRVEAGKTISVALGFRLAGCAAAPVAADSAPSRVAVTFHVGNGPPQRQTLGLGSARLRLTGAACSVRPAARSARAPLGLGGMIELDRVPDVGSNPRKNGMLLRFVPKAHFAVGVVLDNESGKQIVVTAARVVEPRHTLVHQIGTQFHRWSPTTCEGDAPCLSGDFQLHSHVAHPRPFTVPRGKALGVELDYRFGSCGEIPAANPAPVSRLRVTFRTPDGRVHARVLSLGRVRIHLLMPKPEDCAQPRSSLFVQAPDNLFTSSESTRPGSKGDVCSVADGALRFRSRMYLLYARERIYLRLPRFTGRGSYADGIATLVARGKTVFRSDTAKVRVIFATSRKVVAHLFAGHYAHHHERSVPFKISGILRCRVRG